MTGRQPAIRVRSRTDLRQERRRRKHACWGHLIAAPLWPMHGVNLGTLLRTCDAVGACLAVPGLRWVPDALDRGNTLRQPSCVHWVRDPSDWLAAERKGGSRIIGVELAEDATRLADHGWHRTEPQRRGGGFARAVQARRAAVTAPRNSSFSMTQPWQVVAMRAGAARGAEVQSSPENRSHADCFEAP